MTDYTDVLKMQLGSSSDDYDDLIANLQTSLNDQPKRRVKKVDLKEKL